MLNLKKSITIKIITCVTIMAFLFNEAVYASFLRTPLGKGSNRMEEAGRLLGNKRSVSFKIEDLSGISVKDIVYPKIKGSGGKHFSLFESENVSVFYDDRGTYKELTIETKGDDRKRVERGVDKLTVVLTLTKDLHVKKINSYTGYYGLSRSKFAILLKKSGFIEQYPGLYEILKNQIVLGDVDRELVKREEISDSEIAIYDYEEKVKRGEIDESLISGIRALKYSKSQMIRRKAMEILGNIEKKNKLLQESLEQIRKDFLEEDIKDDLLFIERVLKNDDNFVNTTFVNLFNKDFHIKDLAGANVKADYFGRGNNKQIYKVVYELPSGERFTFAMSSIRTTSLEQGDFDEDTINRSIDNWKSLINTEGCGDYAVLLGDSAWLKDYRPKNVKTGSNVRQTLHNDIQLVSKEFVEGQSLREIMDGDSPQYEKAQAKLAALKAYLGIWELSKDKSGKGFFETTARPEDVVLFKDTAGRYHAKIIDFDTLRSRQSLNTIEEIFSLYSGDYSYEIIRKALAGIKKSRELKAILFDMDGTIYVNPELARLYDEIKYRIVADTREISVDSARNLMKDGEEKLRNKTGRAVTSEETAFDLGIDMDIFRKKWNEETEKIDISKYISKDEKIIKTFGSFKNKYKIAVLTNNNRSQAEKILKALGVDGFIDVLVTSTELGEKRKPARDAFMAVKEALGVEYEEIISIGDRGDIDLVPAEAFGMKTLQVAAPEVLYTLDMEKYWRDYIIPAKTILFGVSGGDCAGLNAVLAGLVESANKHGLQVATMDGGFKTLCAGPDAFRKGLRIVNPDEVENLINLPSIISGSSRVKLDEKNQENVFSNVKGFHSVVMIGGDDHARQVGKLAEMLKKQGISVPVFAVLKTVDNDTTAKPVGADTAIEQQRENFLSSCVTAWTHQRPSVYEEMGRERGHLAVGAGDIRISERDRKEGREWALKQVGQSIVTLIPEKPSYLSDLLTEVIKRMGRQEILYDSNLRDTGRRRLALYVNVNVCEGYQLKDFSVEHRNSKDTLFYKLLELDPVLREKFYATREYDIHGNPKLAGVSDYMVSAIKYLPELAKHNAGLQKALDEFRQRLKEEEIPEKEVFGKEKISETDTRVIISGTRQNLPGFIVRGPSPNEQDRAYGFNIGKHVLKIALRAKKQKKLRLTGLAIAINKDEDPLVKKPRLMRIEESAKGQDVTDVYSDKELSEMGVWWDEDTALKAMIHRRCSNWDENKADEIVKGLKKFKADFLDPEYKKRGMPEISLEELAGKIKSTNAFDAYRIEKGLPVTMVFGGIQKNMLHIIYTFNDDFDAVSAVCAKEENSASVVGLAGVRYYGVKTPSELEDLSKEIFGEAAHLADDMSLRNFLWNNSLDGASAVILASGKADKKQVLALWAKSMLNCGILGKDMIVKPEFGSDDADMSVIEQAAEEAKAELKKYGVNAEDFYTPAATSCRSKNGEWSHLRWKSTGVSIVESLIAAVRMLKRHEEDFPGIRPLGDKELKVIICGRSVVSVMVKKLLSLDMYKNILGELGLEIKIVEAKTTKELLSREADVLVMVDGRGNDLENSYKDLKVSLIVEGVDTIEEEGFYSNLQDRGTLTIPSLITGAGGALTSFEEFLHSEVAFDTEDVKEHVLHYIESTSIALTRLVMSRWIELEKQGIKKTLPELTMDIAEEIRQKRDSFLAHPDDNIVYRAELNAIRNVPDDIAMMLACCEMARKEVLFDKEDADLHIKKIQSSENSAGKYGQMDSVYILGEMFEEKAVDALKNVLLDGKRDYRVRRNAAEALGKIGNLSTIDALRYGAKNDMDKKVRAMCEWALECIGVEIEEPKAWEEQTELYETEESIGILADKTLEKWKENTFRKKPRPTLVTVTGFSAAGKSYFSKLFIEKLNKKMEDYFKELRKTNPNLRMNMPGVITIDFDDYILAKEDRPTQLRSLGKMGESQPEKWLGKWEFSRFYKDVQKLRAGRIIYKPSFDQVKRKRKTDENGKEDLTPVKPGYNIIMPEGVFTLSHENTNRYYDLMIFLDAPFELRRARDIERYIREGKYYNLPVTEVVKKFERKHKTEELPSILEERKYAHIILNSGNIPVPEYVDAFYKGVSDYLDWKRDKDSKKEAVSLIDKEEKLKELYQSPGFDGLAGSGLEEKVLTRLYENTVCLGEPGLFKAVSELVARQNKTGWEEMENVQREGALSEIQNKFKLEGEYLEVFRRAAYNPELRRQIPFPHEDEKDKETEALENIIREVMDDLSKTGSYELKTPEAFSDILEEVKEAGLKNAYPAVVKYVLGRQEEILGTLKDTMEKMIALGVPLGGVESPLGREILDNTCSVPNDLYVKYIMSDGETKEGCTMKIGEDEVIFINELYYRESPGKFRGIFAHEAMHLLQRKKVIILGDWETAGLKEVIPQAIGDIIEILYYADQEKSKKSDFELGKKLYSKYGSYKERLKYIKERFSEFVREKYVDEDYIMNSEIDIKEYREDWQRTLGTMIAGMAYGMFERTEQEAYIWQYIYLSASDIAEQAVSGMASEYASISERQRSRLAGDEMTYMDGFRSEILPRIRERFGEKKKRNMPVVAGITGSAVSAKTSGTQEFKKELEKEFGQVKIIFSDDWLSPGRTTENMFEKTEVERFIRSMKLFISGHDLLKPARDQVFGGKLKIGIGENGEIIIYNGKDFTAVVEKDGDRNSYVLVVRKSNGEILEKETKVIIGDIPLSLFKKKDSEDEFVIKIFDTMHFVGAYKDGGREVSVLDSNRNKVSSMIDPKNGEVLADSGAVLVRGGEPWDMKEYIESKSGVYLVEGAFSLYDNSGISKKERLPHLYDETVFFDADFDVRLERGLFRLKYRTLALEGREINFKDIDDYADEFSAGKHFEDIYIYGTKKDARVKVTTQTRTESIFTLFKHGRLTSTENLPVLRELGIHPYLLEKELKGIAEEYIKKSISLYRDKDGMLSSSQRFEGTAFDVFFVGGDLVVKVPIDKQQFDNEIEPFFEKVLNLRAGGVVAPGVILDISSLGMTANIRGEDRALGKVLVQNRAEPLRDRLKGFIEENKFNEAKKLIDEFFELQKKMWELGVLDADLNIIEKYGIVIENGAERIVRFAIDGLSEDPGLYNPDKYRDMAFTLPLGLRAYYKTKIISKGEFNEKYKKYFVAHAGGEKLPDISHSEVNRSQMEHILRILLKTKINQIKEIFEKGARRDIPDGLVWVKLCLDTLIIKNSALQDTLEDLYNQLLDYPILIRYYSKDDMIGRLRERHQDLDRMEVEQLRMIVDALYEISGRKDSVGAPAGLTDALGSLETINSSL